LQKSSLMNLAAFLVSNKVEFEFMEKRATHHAVEAAEASGVPLSGIVKSIVFVDQDARPLLAVVLADADVSWLPMLLPRQPPVIPLAAYPRWGIKRGYRYTLTKGSCNVITSGVAAAPGPSWSN